MKKQAYWQVGDIIGMIQNDDNNKEEEMKTAKINMINLIKNIQDWVSDRNLETQDPRIQMCKTVEELGELANAINKGDKANAMDGIGDVVVTLICISMQIGVDFNECVKTAYNEIKDRKGKMIDGVFVKDEDLCKKGRDER